MVLGIRERMPWMHQNFEQKLVFGESAESSVKRKAMVKLMLDHKIDTVTISGVVGVSERQVYTYQSQIRAGGDIYRDLHYRPDSDLEAEEAKIVSSLKEDPVASSKEAAKRIEELTGIKRSNTQVRTFMHKHDLKPLKTASLPAKMDPAAQRKFLEEELEPRLSLARGEHKAEITMMDKQVETQPILAETGSDIKTTDYVTTAEGPDTTSDSLSVPIDSHAGIALGASINEGKATITATPRNNKPQESVVLFMDAVHCVWQAVLGILWSVERIFIPAASGRKRINVLGAYDPVANKLLRIITRTYINSITVCDMLSQIALAYAGKIITVVLDNAKYQHCELVKNTAAVLGIELLFLPTYSPNLNLIERLWKFLKAKCLTNEFYGTAREFEDAITTCLDKMETEYAEDIRQLMNMKFHLYDTFEERPTYFGKRKRLKEAI